MMWKGINMKKTVRNTIIFCTVTLASGWIGVLVDKVLTQQPEGETLGMGLWLVLPLLTALLLRLFSRDWKDAGLRLNIKGNKKWYLAAVLIYPAVMVITLGLAALFGTVDFSQFNIQAFVSLATVSMLGNLIKNVFEEFAWRGYLTPKLISMKLNDWMIYLIVGIIWALWHAAYYMVFLPDAYFTSISRLGMVVTGCIVMLAWTVMFVEIFRLTKSIWPCVLMHAIEDAFPTVLLMTGGFVTISSKADVWLNPITGVVAVVLFLAIGLALRATRRLKEKELLPCGS